MANKVSAEYRPKQTAFSILELILTEKHHCVTLKIMEKV